VVPGGVQGWDRYAYTLNNPLKYTDPSGHGAYCGDDYDPGCLNAEEETSYWKHEVKYEYGVTLSDAVTAWTLQSAKAIYEALSNAELKFSWLLKKMISGTTFYHGDHDPGHYSGRSTADTITFNFNSGETAPFQNVYHELGHMIDLKYGSYFSTALDNSSVYDSNGNFVMGRNAQGNYDRQTGVNVGYADTDLDDPYWGADAIDAEQHPGDINATDDWGMDGNTASEEWADLFANYVAGNFASDPFGTARMNWFTNTMIGFIFQPG
jgi:hypothetical protein